MLTKPATKNKRMSNTVAQYDEAVKSCKEIFIKKTKDYGTSWRVLRTISVVDQIFIKALRIRTIQEKKEHGPSEDRCGTGLKRGHASGGDPHRR